MKYLHFLRILPFLAAMALIWGCGNGGGDSDSVRKTVSLSAAAKGLEITIVLPDGVTVRADASGTPFAGVVTVTGANAALTNNYSYSLYTPASGSTKGRIRIVLMTDSVFQPGEFFTIACDVAAGVAVTPGQFSYENLKVFDANGAEISGPTAEIGF